MADPELLLKQLPEESPPPEIVLAAVRVFRYRMLATVLVLVALVLGGSLVYSRLQQSSRPLVEIANARYAGGVRFIADTRSIQGATLTLWDVVTTDRASRVWVHLLLTDPQGRSLSIELAGARTGGVPIPSTEVDGSTGSAVAGGTATDVWFELGTPGSPLGVSGPTTFVAQLVRYGQGGRAVVGSASFTIDV